MKIKLNFAILALVIAFIAGGTFPVSAIASQTFSGTEDNIIDITPIKSSSIITFSYTGDGLFSATPMESSGKEGLPYQLKIGDFVGTYFQEAPSKPIVALAIKGSGQWDIVISPLKSAQKSGAKSGMGSGTTVINLGKASTKISRVTWSHEGEGAFIVTPIDAKGKSKFPLFIKIGDYNGTVSLPKGTQYFEIKADGEWKYSIK